MLGPGGGVGQLGYGNTATISDDETTATAGDVDVGGAVRCWGLGDGGRLGYGNSDSIGDDETPASAGNVDIADPGDVVTLGVVGLPAGAVFAPGTPANPISATFTWVPTGADIFSPRGHLHRPGQRQPFGDASRQQH